MVLQNLSCHFCNLYDKLFCMPTLQIQHEVPNYDGWKKVFDSDPINRKRSGVTSYRIYRPKDDHSLVIVDLDFETDEQLNAALQALQGLWSKVQGTVMMNPTTKIFEILEAKVI